MASKYLNGTYNAGYTLSGAYSTVTISTQGSIGGGGLVGGTNQSYTIVNLGGIAASTSSASGILLRAGGTVANGSTAITTAQIVGGRGSAVPVSSSYTLVAGGAGISLAGGGSIANTGTIIGGAGFNAFASRGGAGGVGIDLSGGGTIGNSGKITGGGGGTGNVGAAGGAGGAGISLSSGGSIGNTGTIAGGSGGAGGPPPRAGLFAGPNGPTGAAITLAAGGVITNGSPGASAALIQGGIGIEASGTASVTVINYGMIAGVGGAAIHDSGGPTTIANFGSITAGGGGIGIDLAAGGTITNGSAAFTTARIAGGAGQDAFVVSNILGGSFQVPSGPGGSGINFSGGGSIGNAGTIIGGQGGAGLAGNTGTAGVASAGGAGISLAAGGSIGNTGLIAGGQGGAAGGSGGAGTAGAGVSLAAGGIVTNGGLGARMALIQGGIGIAATGTAGATVTNFATIASLNGTGGTAIGFANASSVLILEGGSRLVGKAAGAAGTLDLAGAGGTGTLSGLGSQYTGFAQYAVLSGANWTLAGGNTIGNGATLTNGSTLIDAGQLFVGSGGVATGVTVSSGGSEIVSAGGSVGQPIIAGGLLELASGATASGAIAFAGGVTAGRLQIDGTAMPSNTISGFVSGDSVDLANIVFDSAGSAAVAAGNVLQVTEGGTTYSLNLDPAQDFAHASFHLASDGKGGTLISVAVRAQLTFFAPGIGADNINLVLTADGSGLPAPITGKFNIEVFTSAPGALATGYAASAFIPGGSSVANNIMQTGTLGEPLQLLHDDYLMVDHTGQQSITVSRAGHASVAGSRGDTITGLGSDTGPLDMLIDASGTNPDVTPGPMTIVGGDGATTVWGGTGDMITGNATFNFGLTVDGARGGNTISGGTNRGNFGAAAFAVTGATVSGAAGDTIIGAQGSNSTTYIAAGVKDVISSGEGNTTIAGNLGSTDTINGGVGATTIYGSANDHITGGTGAMYLNDAIFAGAETVVGGAGNLTVFSIGKNFSITGSTGGTTFIDDNYGKGGNSNFIGGSGTVTGAGGLAVNTVIIGAPSDTVSGSSGTTYIDGILGLQSITAGSGATTVQGAIGDTVTGGSGTLLAYLNSDQATTTVNLGTGSGVATLQDVSVAGGKGSAISVTGFAAATDIVGSTQSVDTSDKFLGSSTSDGKGGTILTFLDGSKMTLAGVAFGTTTIKFLHTLQ